MKVLRHIAFSTNKGPIAICLLDLEITPVAALLHLLAESHEYLPLCVVDIVWKIQTFLLSGYFTASTVWVNALFLPGSRTQGLCATLGDTGDRQPRPPCHPPHSQALEEQSCPEQSCPMHALHLALGCRRACSSRSSPVAPPTVLTSFSWCDELCCCSHPPGWFSSTQQQGWMRLFSSHLLFPFATQATFWSFFHFFPSHLWFNPALLLQPCCALVPVFKKKKASLCN